MADSEREPVAEAPPLAREVLVPPRQRRSVIALAIAVGLAGAASARLRWHHHHGATHRCPEAEIVRLRAEIRALEAERIAVLAAAKVAEQLDRIEATIERSRSFGNLGEADLVEPTLAPAK